MATFEEQLNGLLDRTKNIKSPINTAPIGTNIMNIIVQVKYGLMMLKFFIINT